MNMEKSLQNDLEKIIKSRCDEVGLEYVEPEPLLKEEMQSIIERRCEELGIPFEDGSTKNVEADAETDADDKTKGETTSPAKRVYIKRRIKKVTHVRKKSLDSDTDADTYTEKASYVHAPAKKSVKSSEDDAYWHSIMERRRLDNMADMKSAQLKSH